jgi:hypothetical protein
MWLYFFTWLVMAEDNSFSQILADQKRIETIYTLQRIASVGGGAGSAHQAVVVLNNFFNFYSTNFGPFHPIALLVALGLLGFGLTTLGTSSPSNNDSSSGPSQ